MGDWYINRVYIFNLRNQFLKHVVDMKQDSEGEFSSHFRGKDALKHIVEVQADGLIASEIHGAETPGSLLAGFDSARETAFILVLQVFLFSGFIGAFSLTNSEILLLMIGLSAGLFLWKIGRSSWLAWARLERLHRVAFEEQREIQANRPQEREELRALYRAKGFQGKLLEDVVDVLMADSDRLLRVMLQEEMGFRLEENEHPLIQGLGAGLGVLSAAVFAIGSYYFFGVFGLCLGVAVLFALASSLSAYMEKNRATPAVIWNIAIAVFALTSSLYIMKYMTT